MTRVEAIEQEIQKLSREEFAQLRDWLAEKDWQEWDRRLEKDVASGRLDAVFEETLRAHRASKSPEL